MSDDITHDLDLLGDWLDAKGYGEEAGLCTRAMDEINKLREERHELKNELAKWVNYWRDKDVKALSAENEKLRLERDVFYIEYRMVCDEECKIVHAENERLRAALKPFAEKADHHTQGAYWMDAVFTVDECRAAAAALKEMGDV